MARNICSIDDCSRWAYGYSYCKRHYYRYKKYGNPLTGRFTESHGMHNTSEYKTWSYMKRRCNNPKDPRYHDYGGRGIKVCDRWQNSFRNFYEDMGDKPTPDHSIDRINNDGNYEPGNCRWATSREQASNKRVRKDSSTGIPGIIYDNTTNSYAVRISINGTAVWGGRYKTLHGAKAMLDSLKTRKEIEEKL